VAARESGPGTGTGRDGGAAPARIAAYRAAGGRARRSEPPWPADTPDVERVLLPARPPMPTVMPAATA